MKVSLICPVYNSVESIRDLIESMLSQTKKADEIIFVDSLSTDGTAEIIKEYKKQNVKLISQKSNIAEARNIAIKNSKNQIIACTDTSSKLDKDWLKNIIKPFEDLSVDVVSGGYVASSNGGIQDYIAMVTIKPMEEWDEKTFLPSGRSIAFKKKAWSEVGGYPEQKQGNQEAGEDTLFDLKLKEKGFKFKLARDALIQWEVRKSLRDFCFQFYRYGKGDGKTKCVFKVFPYFTLWSMGSLIFLLFIFFLFSNLIIAGSILLLILFYFILQGFFYSFKRKRLGAIVYIPLLLFCKRFFYILGVWRGI